MAWTTGRARAALLGVALLFSAPAAADTLRLSLTDAIRVATERSPAATQASVTRTGGVTTLARGINGILPSASGSVDYGWNQAGSDSTSQGWTAGLTVSQVVFSPSAFAGVVSSCLRFSSSSLSAREQQAQLVYNATADYLDLLKTGRLRDVARAAFERATGYLDLTREKNRLGMASSIELLRAEVQEAQARLGVLEADQNFDIAMQTFKATAGLERNTVVVPTDDLTAPGEFEVTDPDSLVAEIERRNPGTRMATRARTIARVNQVATVGSVLPDVSVYWQRTSSAASLPACLTDWREGGTSSYGLRATLPLLDLKAYVLNVVDAASESRRASAAARLANLQIRSTAASAVGSYLSARKRYDLAQATLSLNERLYELARQQLRLGEISQVDFLDVEANLVDAQASRIGAICDTYVRAANIAYLLGSDVNSKP